MIERALIRHFLSDGHDLLNKAAVRMANYSLTSEQVTRYFVPRKILFEWVMSWEVANDKKLLGQFASGSGLAHFRRTLEGRQKDFPALTDFLEHGETRDVEAVRSELKRLAAESDDSVRVIAKTLYSLIDGQSIVIIIQG